ncbi:hypothetical protein PVAG01_06265 [Phlyctema vagabunda]|uniref:Uncharacterized protein n=1 Tax=Phlyctema vagabunda TaxID=108571 RepID=A0ABR4PFM3_9HELO
MAATIATMTSNESETKTAAGMIAGLFLAMFTNNLDTTINASDIPYITDQFYNI